MRRKITAIIFCQASVSAETLKAFHAPGMKEAFLSNCTFRVALADPGARKTSPIRGSDGKDALSSNRLNAVVVGETGAGKTAFMSRLISEFLAGGSGDRLPD